MSSALSRISLHAGLILLLASCGTSPTEAEIISSLEDADERAVRSVAGLWLGVAQWPETMKLEFVLGQGSPGQVSGSGTMRESAEASPVPITVQGTYQRPNLVLTFSGVVYDGNPVTATFAGRYERAAGIMDSLRITGEGYSKAIELLLQEQ
jgi:hypothetical protein